MQTVELFTGIIFTAIGLLAITGAVANWDWFFRSHNAAFFVRTFGRKGARWFYALLGALIVVVGVMMATGLLK